eukprot:jgi/Mesen1/10334/ME000008S10111
MASFSMVSLKAALPCVGVSSVSHSRTSARVAVKPRVMALQGFSGLRSENALKLSSEVAVSSFTTLVDNGSKWFAMRHGKRVPRLGRPADQRKALLRALTTEILRHGRIKTTQARAKAMRKYVDHMITLAKGGSLHQRRQALGFIYDKNLVHSIFAEVPERYGERDGGYTRIIRTMPRRGDNAPMAYIELV